MKPNFFDIVLALGWCAARIFRTCLLKEKANVYKLKYFISKNDFKDCSFYSPRDFQCAFAGRIWGRHTKQTIGFGGRKNHFLKTDNLNNK